MKKFAIALGIAVAILVSAFGIGIATAMANSAVINKTEDTTIDVVVLVDDYVEDNFDFVGYDLVRIDSIKYDVNSKEIETICYSVYDRNNKLIGGGVVSWSSLVAYIN